MELLDAVQEGNAAMLKAIQHFRGGTSDEFLRQMTADVDRTLLLMM